MFTVALNAAAITYAVKLTLVFGIVEAGQTRVDLLSTNLFDGLRKSALIGLIGHALTGILFSR